MLPFGRYLLLTGAFLVLLFTALRPAASGELSFLGRLAFWAVHIGPAMLILALVTTALARVSPRGARRSAVLVLVAGVIGSVLFAPIALGVEALFGDPGAADEGGLPRALDRAGLLGDVVDEAIAVAPSVTASWLLINVPWLLRVDARRRQADSPDPTPYAVATSPAPGSAPESEPASAARWLERLPAALGRDVVAISSELHYLRVYTTNGETMILHSLRDAIDELGPGHGLRIHRSHWVARAHVVRVRREGRRVICHLTGGLALPVSRSHQQAVLGEFGDRARYVTGPPGA